MRPTSVWRIRLGAALCAAAAGCFESSAPDECLPACPSGYHCDLDQLVCRPDLDGGGEDGTVADDAGPADDAGVDEGGGTDDGGPVEPGECRTSEDCGGRACVRVPDEPGGYRLCRGDPVEEATECRWEFDECCNSTECVEGPDGGCYLTTSCGGAWMEQNRCQYDECATASECGEGGVCVPRNLLGLPRSRCLYGSCRTAADCTLEPGGFCAPIGDPCCAGYLGFYCVYPGRCLNDEDCTGSVCMPAEDGGTFCDLPACPA